MYIKSPLNYTGGKYKMLGDLFKCFPSEIDTFVDLFGGGFNVGINVNSNRVIYNDNISYLGALFSYLRDNSIESILQEIENIISEYELNLTNLDGYNKLRSAYNVSKDSVVLFVLVCYSFNHQIRFNNKHEFNISFGKDRSAYNSNIRKNLVAFCEVLKSKYVEFYSMDFNDFPLDKYSKDCLIYCDPPYLLTNGSYNDGKRGFKGWTRVEEVQLLTLLDRVNREGKRFALSNVLYHKGSSNELLIEWSKRYKVNYIDKVYSNCSYQFKDRDTKTVEVVVTNY